jgi:hypothetical protein
LILFDLRNAPGENGMIWGALALGSLSGVFLARAGFPRYCRDARLFELRVFFNLVSF